MDRDHDDPLKLIDAELLNSHMTPKAHAAFKVYCLMAPGVRSLRALHKQLGKEWSSKAPDRTTLYDWSSAHNWQALLIAYDAAVARQRAHENERRRREYTERALTQSRSLSTHASAEIQRLIDANNAPQEPLRDSEGNILVNPRTGQPVMPKPPSLAGMQALGYVYKVAMEAERLALGLPTSISDSKVQAAVETTTTPTTTIDEWREHTRTEREVAAARTPQRLLPPARYTTRVPDDLTPEEAEALPDDWFGEVVDEDIG